jgi:uncharacterized damage-inducible protein DinB
MRSGHVTIAQSLLPEFDTEMATTRRVIERVPTDRGEWKPHPKSFSLGHLTQLVATMPGWITATIAQGSLDLGKMEGYGYHATDVLLSKFDRMVGEARAALAEADDAAFAADWSLMMNGKVLFTSPRGVVVRQNINHLVHHRGQLTVYLRLLDVPVPSIYGPTADDPGFMG